MSTMLSIKDAADWASNFLQKKVTKTNIMYLVQYGRINKHEINGVSHIDIDELTKYYNQSVNRKNEEMLTKLGDDLNLHLSFSEYSESETTKHVHRLHPYKGKFIPQLVRYFLDSHTDEFKKTVYFKEGDYILDPFCGSGTTLVEANELGINAVGIDISEFNQKITNVKISKVDISHLEQEINHISKLIEQYRDTRIVEFDDILTTKLSEYNKKYFPSPEYKIKVHKKEIEERLYSESMLNDFLPQFYSLQKQMRVDITKYSEESYLKKWYIQPVFDEIRIISQYILGITKRELRDVLSVLLSRVVRSCRATTHSDLVTLQEPVTKPYYCVKHFKICKPIMSIEDTWKKYGKDTVRRLIEFDKLRTNTHQVCLRGDSRSISVIDNLNSNFPDYILPNRGKFNGVFTSPPYVGVIDYHEQHAYAYEIFGYQREDESEIGPLFMGKGKQARSSYVQGISNVLNNCKRFLVENYDIFIVANDTYNLYPEIAENCNMEIVQTYKRPVINRAERDRNHYSEFIFHLKEKSNE